MDIQNEILTLPTRSAFGDLQPGIPNIHASDFTPVKPGLAYNSQNRRKFYIPKKGPLISNAVSLAATASPRFVEGDYISKVSRDAVEAYMAVEKHKAQQVVFDELDKDNVFPRKGRMVPIINGVSTTRNSDGTYNAYHQPGHMRFMQNQPLGDVSKVVERPTPPGNPSIGNRPENYTTLASNHTIHVTNNGTQTSEEVGRIGGKKGPIISPMEQDSRMYIPSSSVTKDFRTTSTSPIAFSPMSGVKYPSISPVEYKVQPMEDSPVNYKPIYPKVEPMEDVKYSPVNYKPIYPKIPHRDNSDEELKTRMHILGAPSTGQPFKKSRTVQDDHEAEARLKLLGAPIIPSHDPNMGWHRGNSPPNSPWSSPRSPRNFSPPSSPSSAYPRSPVELGQNIPRVSTSIAAQRGILNTPQIVIPTTLIEDPARSLTPPLPRRSSRKRKDVNYKEPDARSNAGYVKKRKI
ncbi:hypothetical protein DFS34DRAFT_591520 [Phlyctochytrium arcticum]|nr:hypothetical protein DFS34DRAFT_591520 [Phlyctochytrium arcticum]